MHKRIQYIDIAKGICILLVILGHELTWDDAARYFIYSFHIPMFFALSGVTMRLTHECEKTKKDFILKNVTGILFPYLEMSVLYFLWDLISWLASGKLSFHLIALDFGQIVTGYGINVLWFLSTLFFAKLIFYQLVRGSKKNNSIIGMLMIFVTGNVLLIVVPYLLCEFPANLVGRYIEWGLISILRPVIAVFFLGFGYYGYPLFENRRKNRGMSISLLALSICLIPVFLQGKITLVNMVSNPFFMVFLTGTSGTTAVLMACSLLEGCRYLSRLLTYFGKNSLIIMLTHEYIPVRAFIQKSVEQVINNYFLQILVTFFAIVVVEALICKLWGIYRVYWRRIIKA